MSPRPGRSLDRRLTVAGIGVAALYLAAAGCSLALPAAERHGLWLPLHLAFLGGGGTAIVAVLPFFAASLSAVPPPSPVLRGAGIILVAAGAAAVTGGVTVWGVGLALVGAALVLGGAATTAVTLAAVLRTVPAGRTSDRAGIAHAATLAGLGALGSLSVGGLLAVLYLAGVPSVVVTWPTVRIAHAWLNLFGFVGLVVVSTLVHLLPTAFGTRIAGRTTGLGAVVALAAGTVLGAAGVLGRSDALARLGAVGLLASVGCLALEAIRVWRARGRWTTDLGWHRFVGGALLGGIAWYGSGVAIVAGRILVEGATPSAWDLQPLIVPLGAGWLASVLLGSASHLVPSIGPGDPAAHAAIRRRLGQAATLRLIGLHLGVLLAAGAGLGDAGGAGSGAASLWAAVGLVGQLGWLASAGVSTALLGWAVLAVLGRR